MVRQGIWCLGVTSAGPKRCCDCVLKKSRRDGRKNREGLQQIVTCGPCCCVLVSCHRGFPPLGSLFQKCPRETRVCLPYGWGFWLNHPSLQDDHAIASAEGLQGPGVFPKANKNLFLFLKDWGEAGGNTLCIATALLRGRKT